MCNTYLSCTLNIKSIWRVDRVTCFDILCRKMFISFLFIFLGFEMRSVAIFIEKYLSNNTRLSYLEQGKIDVMTDKEHCWFISCHSLLMPEFSTFLWSLCYKNHFMMYIFYISFLYFPWIFYTPFPHSFTAFLNFQTLFHVFTRW